MVTTRARLVLAAGFLAACGLTKQGTLDDGSGLDGGELLDAGAVPDAADAAVSADASLGVDASGDAVAPEVDAGPDAFAPSDAGASDSSSDASRDAAADSGVDSGTDSGVRPDACSPQGPEDCTNGVDDDCDGLADCADPECSPQYECVPEVPTGWSKAALSVGARPNCPGGYASSRDVVLDPTGGAASCVCSCSSSGAASCVKGNVTFYGPNIFGTDCSTIGSTSTSVGDGACQPNLPFGLFGFGINANANVRVSSVALTPNSCTGNVQKTVPSAGASEGKRCLVSAVLGGGCSAGQVCARRTGTSFQSCVAKSGANACPVTWPTKHDTGTSISDTRSCTTCTCGTTASCGPATVTFFENNSCGGASVSVTADNACRAMSTPGQAVSSWRYSAQVQNEGCQKTADAQPSGAIAFNGQETVCCR